MSNAEMESKVLFPKATGCGDGEILIKKTELL
jgi:hypothetical protein